MTTQYILLPDLTNPDTKAITEKDTINIGVSVTDITASNATESIKLNSTLSEVTVYVDSLESNGSTYYTPVYSEKISYETWKKTVNKSFQELSAL